MSIRYTRNMLSNKPVIKIGYCAAQTILSGLPRAGYTCGIYGWNADVYDFGSCYILTGYRFNGIRGKYAPFEAVDALEKEARRAVNECGWIDQEGINFVLNCCRRQLIDICLEK